MAVTRNFCPRLGNSSVFTLATTKWPAVSFATLTISGATILHGPHHGAQKSTSTGKADRLVSASKTRSLLRSIGSRGGCNSFLHWPQRNVCPSPCTSAGCASRSGDRPAAARARQIQYCSWETHGSWWFRSYSKSDNGVTFHFSTELAARSISSSQTKNHKQHYDHQFESRQRNTPGERSADAAGKTTTLDPMGAPGAQRGFINCRRDRGAGSRHEPESFPKRQPVTRPKRVAEPEPLRAQPSPSPGTSPSPSPRRARALRQAQVRSRVASRPAPPA